MNKINSKISIKVPVDLSKALADKPSVQALWNNLTPIAQRDFIGWISSVKGADFRARRIARVPDMLLSGKRRPCCYAIVPMNLYKALGNAPKAKAVWKELTPDERRDFVSWVNEGKDSEERAMRIAKVCVALAAGKRKM